MIVLYFQNDPILWDVYSAIAVNFLVDQDLFSMICVEKFTDEFIVNFRKALNHSNKILEYMNNKSEVYLYNVINKLSTSIKGLNKILDPIWKQVEIKTISYQRANMIILRCIPLLNIYGYQHLLYSMYKSDKSSEVFIEEFYCNFIKEYGNLEFF